MKELRNKEDQYNAFLNYNETRKKPKDNFGKTIMVLVLISVVMSVSAFLYYVFTNDSEEAMALKESLMAFVQKYLPSDSKNFNLQFLNRKQNILVLGVDSNGENSDPFKGTRSDTILLFNIDPHTHSVNAISIPRDSKVYVANGHGVQKINAAHALGGVETTKKTIEDTLGVRIDNYIVISTAGVRKLVDTIGGVPIYIEKDMYYNDNAGGLHINLNKGVHVLYGKDVEGYLRYRKDGLGDIGRTSRQQWFLKALMEKLQTPEAITKIPEALKIANSYIKTDMNLYQLSQYAALMRGIDLDSIEVATLPGAPNKKGYISYWILDPEKTQEVVDRMIYRHKASYEDKQLVAGIMYSFDKEAEAMRIKEELKENGYEVNCIGRAHLPHSQVIGHNAAVTGEFVNSLKKKIPEVKHSQFVYDPIRTYCVKSDFTIIVSGS
ncbi:MAG: LCP family protein [Candidatus Gastranaerophilales bacterium]|nr:LCP family protein [Candidatus Gastranaerophilales bacterium]